MQRWMRILGLTGISACVAMSGLACERHDHRSMSTYDYSDERAPDRHDPAPMETERPQPDSEWRMRSPGQMVVDPSRK